MKIICIDFDGVLHSYTSGWCGVAQIPDPPVPGALGWLEQLIVDGKYKPVIYSSRSKEDAGIAAMQSWLIEQFEKEGHTEAGAISYVDELEFPDQKPPAYLTIDDRAICFRGTFPSMLEMDNFKPWNK